MSPTQPFINHCINLVDSSSVFDAVEHTLCHTAQLGIVHASPPSVYGYVAFPTITLRPSYVRSIHHSYFDHRSTLSYPAIEECCCTASLKSFYGCKITFVSPHRAWFCAHPVIKRLNPENGSQKQPFEASLLPILACCGSPIISNAITCTVPQAGGPRVSTIHTLCTLFFYLCLSARTIASSFNLGVIHFRIYVPSFLSVCSTS